MNIRPAVKDGIAQIHTPIARTVHPEKAAHRSSHFTLSASKADAMCKDLVNAPKRAETASEGVVMVSFLGAGGKEISIECPKVESGSLLCQDLELTHSITFVSLSSPLLHTMPNLCRLSVQ